MFFGVQTTSALCRTVCRNCLSRYFHRTAERKGLEEFFDVPKNFGAQEVRTGRPWRLEELRMKSNADLHRLWYVLLKEKNMLLTMEAACERETELFPNPERLDKVEESMENLESVVRERNAAVLELEHGVTGQPPQRTVTTVLGIRQTEDVQEHIEPAFMHPDGKRYEMPYLNDEQRIFQKLWKEKIWWDERGKEDDRKRKAKEHKEWHQY